MREARPRRGPTGPHSSPGSLTVPGTPPLPPAHSNHTSCRPLSDAQRAPLTGTNLYQLKMLPKLRLLPRACGPLPASPASSSIPHHTPPPCHGHQTHPRRVWVHMSPLLLPKSLSSGTFLANPHSPLANQLHPPQEGPPTPPPGSFLGSLPSPTPAIIPTPAPGQTGTVH